MVGIILALIFRGSGRPGPWAAPGGGRDLRRSQPSSDSIGGPVEVTTLEWGITLAVTIGVLLFDVIVIARDPHEPSLKECATALSRLRRRRDRLRRVGVDLPRPRLRDRVLHRLADRVQPLDRQPVRLHRPDGRAQGPAEVPAGSADGGHHPGADLPRHLHRPRLPARSTTSLGLLRLRRVPRLHRRTAWSRATAPTRTSTPRTTGRQVRPEPPQRRARSTAA